MATKNLADTGNTKSTTPPKSGKGSQSYTVPPGTVPPAIQRDPWGVTPNGSNNTLWTDGSVSQAPVPGSGGGGENIGIGQLPGLGDEDYLAGDAQYQAQLAALMKALETGNADFEAQKSRYQTTFDDSLRQLGWQGGPDPASGAWNQEDLNTASGRAFQNQLNDFASRGLLQSSLYATSNDNLMRSLNDQFGGMNTARTGFLDDIARQQAALQNQNTTDAQNARAEALARRAAGMSLV